MSEQTGTETVCEPGARASSPGGMTYFVDPQAGSDQRGGMSRADAWRTFAPVNQLRLGAGDRVEVVSPGTLERTLALSGEGTAASPITVHFAPGRYDVERDTACTRTYDISNTNAEPDGDKAVAILLEHCRHVTITGPGARLVCRGKMIELCIDHSEAVAVRDLAFDYHRPTVSEFTVTAVTDSFADLAVHADSDYTIEEGQLVWRGEGWSYPTGLAQELEPERDVIWRRQDPLMDLKAEALGPFRVRMHGAHDMVAGRTYQLRDTFRDCVGVFMRRSRQVELRQLDFIFIHGMGILCQFTEDITLDTVNIAPDEASGRTCAAWADCTHFSGCRGTITVRNCLFCGAHDDAMNVHGTHLRIVEQPAPNQVKVRFMHRQTYGFMAFNSGDEIAFVRWDSMAPFQSNRVVAAEMLNPKDLLLTLEHPAPDDWHEDDVLENVTWTPQVEVTGCTVRRIPTRGFLLTTPRRVTVTDNTFVRPFRNGIHVEADAEGWFESGSVRDMTIAGNHFVACGTEAIRISPHNSKPNSSVHQNISIRDNEFVVVGAGTVLSATGTTGLTVVGNRVVFDGERDRSALIATGDCARVTVEGNKYES